MKHVIVVEPILRVISQVTSVCSDNFCVAYTKCIAALCYDLIYLFIYLIIYLFVCLSTRVERLSRGLVSTAQLYSWFEYYELDTDLAWFKLGFA